MSACRILEVEQISGQKVHSTKRIPQKLMKIYSENIQYLDKFTLRKVQMDFYQQSEGLHDSLEAWIETYLRLTVIGMHSE